MNTLKYICGLLCLLAVYSCKKDSIVTNTTTQMLNEAISGSVHIDDDYDDKGDTEVHRLNGMARVYWGDLDLIEDILGQLPDTLESPYDDILWADVDSFGQYLIEGVPPTPSKFLVLYSDLPIDTVFARDNTSDGDAMEEEINSYIPISVELNEHDNGNDFVIQLLGSASGYIQEDTDNDGIGDIPATGHYLKLYERDINGFPTGDILQNAVSNWEGFYKLGVVPEGEYVIQYGQSGYLSLSGEDLTPEAGEPTIHPESNLIQLDVNDTTIEDTDNNFDVKLKVNCSGYVLQDLDGDGIGDVGVAGELVEFYKDNGIGSPEGSLISSALTDENGFYQINSNVGTGNYVLVYIRNNDYLLLDGGDESVENGENTFSPDIAFIPVFWDDETETDEDNIYHIRKSIKSINGYILLDENDDLIGDSGSKDHRLELYSRNEEGVPQGNLVAWTYSDGDGYFEFVNIPPGEYVIYNIGNPDCYCTIVKSGDESAEPGEPTESAELIFIPVNLNNALDEDSDNIYIVKQN